MPPVKWIAEQSEQGAVLVRVGRDGEDLVAEFGGLGQLRARGGRGPGRFIPDAGADDVSIAKLHEGLIPALLRQLDGKVSLHGAVATRGGAALACIGTSGAGKSTSVAELCERHDAALLADDVTAVEMRESGAWALPMERSHWLLPSSREALGLGRDEGKTRVSPRRLADAPARLVAICQLVFDDTSVKPALRRLEGAEAFQALLGCTIRFAIDDRALQLRELDGLGSIQAQVPVWELRRPRAASLLPVCGAELSRLLARGGAR
jgi:hypothetical protein